MNPTSSLAKRRSRLAHASALTVLSLGVSVGAFALPAETATAANPSWYSYVLGSSSSTLSPVNVEGRGDVSHPNSLERGKGKATTLTTVAGQTPASVLLDFGKDIAGIPFFNVTALEGAPTLSLVTSEARQFIRTPANTTVSVAAAAGGTQVTLASSTGLEVGNTITFGTGDTAQTRTITAFTTVAPRVVTLSTALTSAV